MRSPCISLHIPLFPSKVSCVLALEVRCRLILSADSLHSLHSPIVRAGGGVAQPLILASHPRLSSSPLILAARHLTSHSALTDRLHFAGAGRGPHRAHLRPLGAQGVGPLLPRQIRQAQVACRSDLVATEPGILYHASLAVPLSLCLSRHASLAMPLSLCLSR